MNSAVCWSKASTWTPQTQTVALLHLQVVLVERNLILGLNSLHLASKEGHVQVVETVLNRGGKVDAATNVSDPAFWCSCSGSAQVTLPERQHGPAHRSSRRPGGSHKSAAQPRRKRERSGHGGLGRDVRHPLCSCCITLAHSLYCTKACCGFRVASLLSTWPLRKAGLQSFPCCL